MNWYIAKLVYQFTCGNGLHIAQFNEQLRLIVAEDALHAFYKARLIGERETVTVMKDEMPIQWKFIDVTEILPVDNLSDGAEVWSCSVEEVIASQYIQTARLRSTRLLERSMELVES